MTRIRKFVLCLSLILLLCATALGQLFPVQIVYDPRNEVHFLAQLAELVKSYEQLITTYNQIVYNAQILNNKAQWVITLNNWVRTTAPDTYFLNAPWLNAINTGIRCSSGLRHVHCAAPDLQPGHGSASSSNNESCSSMRPCN